MKVLLIAFLGMLPLMAEEKPVAEQKPDTKPATGDKLVMEKVGEKEIQGQWVMTRSKGKLDVEIVKVLDLRKDKTFTQTFERDGKAVEQSGMWECQEGMLVLIRVMDGKYHLEYYVAYKNPQHLGSELLATQDPGLQSVLLIKAKEITVTQNELEKNGLEPTTLTVEQMKKDTYNLVRKSPAKAKADKAAAEKAEKPE